MSACRRDESSPHQLSAAHLLPSGPYLPVSTSHFLSFNPQRPVSIDSAWSGERPNTLATDGPLRRPAGSPLPSPGSPLVFAGAERPAAPLFCAELEEIRVSPAVSRRGLLQVYEEQTQTWLRRWLVSGSANGGATPVACRARVSTVSQIPRGR